MQKFQTAVLVIVVVTLSSPKSSVFCCVTVDGPPMRGPNGTEAIPNVGKPCVFPFTVNGVTFNSCTTRVMDENSDSDSCKASKHQEDLRPICSTLVDEGGNHVPTNYSAPQNWGYCASDCPSGKPKFYTSLPG